MILMNKNLIVLFRKSVVLRANSGMKYMDSPIVIEGKELTSDTPSAEGVLIVNFCSSITMGDS